MQFYIPTESMPRGYQQLQTKSGNIYCNVVGKLVHGITKGLGHFFKAD